MTDLQKRLMALAEKHGVDVTPSKSVKELVKSTAINELLISKSIAATAICRSMGVCKSGFEAYMHMYEINKSLEE